jgi:hypothetical protein
MRQKRYTRQANDKPWLQSEEKTTIVCANDTVNKSGDLLH